MNEIRLVYIEIFPLSCNQTCSSLSYPTLGMSPAITSFPVALVKHSSLRIIVIKNCYVEATVLILTLQQNQVFRSRFWVLKLLKGSAIFQWGKKSAKSLEAFLMTSQNLNVHFHVGNFEQISSELSIFCCQFLQVNCNVF